MRVESLAGIDPKLIARFENFCAFTMAHPRLLAVRDRLMDAIDGAAPGSLIMLLGPRFLWKDYFSRFLMAMAEPLINRKVGRPANRWDVPESIPDAATCTGSELGYAMEQALRFRRPPVVLVDEAQHLARIASGRKLSDQLDVIKSIANRTQTVHVLLGTYELLPFRNLSGQLSRRSVDLHFARYSADSPEDMQIFHNILLTFQKQAPFAKEPDLLGLWEFLYERSVGCVGILKDWLVRASVASLKNGDATLSLEELERTALSVSQCEKILIESREGEVLLSDSEDSRSRLRTLLGINSPKAECTANGSPRTGTRKNRRVGHRQPKRDPIETPMPMFG